MSKKIDANVFAKTRRTPKGVRENTWKKKHGLTDTRLYNVWLNMKQRCYNPKNPKYVLYGGKGIVIDDRWKNDFVGFMEWALSHGYRVGLTIDRVDSAKNYCPENCRWVDVMTQNHNTNRNINITFGGKMMCLSEWARALKINRNTLRARLDKGWSVEKALTTPVDKFFRRNCK